MDILVTSPAANQLSLFRGNNDGTFGSPEQFPISGSPRPVITGSFFGDQFATDAMVGTDNGVIIVGGNEQGDFFPDRLDAETQGPISDLVSITQGFPSNIDWNTAETITDAGLVQIKIADSFTISYPVGSQPNYIKAADLNGDGNLDLVLANGSSNFLSLLLATAPNIFANPTSVPIPGVAAGPSADGLAVADFNSDGFTDIAVMNGGTVSVLLGDGTGNFTVANSFFAGTGSHTLVAADFNADGKADLAFLNDTKGIQILLGDGTGHFTPSMSLAVGRGPLDITVSDLNLDGYPDLLVPNSLDQSVSVFLNSSATGFTVSPLFDTTKAYKLGSTIPIKLQVLDCSGADVSSSSLALSAFDLRLVGSATSNTILDAGDSNPDLNFRFNSTLGSTGGYIFNLSTKNLSPGQFMLRFYIGGNTTVPYSITFQVK